MTACEFNDNNKSDYIKFMDNQKFLQFVAIFTKTVTIDNVSLRDMRIRFIFKLFDKDNNDEIDRLEFRNLTTAFVELVLNLKFDSELLMDKLKALNFESNNVTIMDKVLDQYVDDVFDTYSYSGEILTYDEWCKWFFSISGIEKVLDYVGSLRMSN
jgi:Ca2+-binding EF-hand superfamily protein